MITNDPGLYGLLEFAAACGCGFIFGAAHLLSKIGKLSQELPREWWARGVEYGRQAEREKPAEQRQMSPCPWSPNTNWSQVSAANTIGEAIEQFRRIGISVDDITVYSQAGVVFASTLDSKTGTRERVALRTFPGVYSFAFSPSVVDKYESVLQKIERGE